MVEEAYPGHSGSTLVNFFRDVNNEATARTGWGIQGAIIDHDWTDFGTYEDLLWIQDNIRFTIGIAFGVIFWNASPSMDWYDGLMYQGGWYQGFRMSGLMPDFYEINNWTGLPDTTLGETSADYKSFTNSVRDFVHRFLPFASLPSNGYLYPGQSIASVDGRFSLTYESNGNLVLRNLSTSQELWSSNTNGTSPGFLAMQGNGNLVLYDASGNPTPLSNTAGNPGAFLVVQGDGNLVIYSDYRNEALWATDTAGY
jgi:hypothetical protein